MDGRSRRWHASWIGGYVATVALVGLLAGVAVLGRGPVRGETYASFFGDWSSSTTTLTNGVFNVHGVAHTAERVSWDAVTSVVLVPVLLLITSALARGSRRARIVAVGGLVAVVLQQCAYVGTWSVESSLALLSLLVLVAAMVGSVRIASPVAGRSLTDGLPLASSDPAGPVTPVGTWVALSLFWLVFGGLVIGMFAAELGVDTAPPASGEPTLVGLPVSGWAVATVVVAVGVGLWRRHVLGQLLAAIFLVTTVFLGLANVVMVVTAWVVGGVARPFALLLALVVTAGSVGALRFADRRLRAVEYAAVAPGPSTRSVARS
jgi:hypothetical protein